MQRNAMLENCHRDQVTALKADIPFPVPFGHFNNGVIFRLEEINTLNQSAEER